ncbi:hypothetical protein C3747_159g62 [Trypanosoma cruzi]|uniref:Uncharacterized protein n=2 Tax=Trypanosoma cruzi TaxID=5693 RepID=Q4DKB0_TRYCC|nr:hypothetical protein, conserved [Trypanosoma cruzi]EAN92965.1 hypothetical protein, conserved [Trypanosoma cruzi]PWV04198.1 hypothetical protein C3747_159g62 [Trypanosoma cruzi]|eukprot:XP_814816.1 hypothetical protein [Trypanosoma cruzi strain CL Brener]
MTKITKGERTYQEKSLNRLQWLIQRSKVGFKGNPCPFEPTKTQKSVALAKKRAADQLAGDTEFLPFCRGVPSLSEDASPTEHLRGVDNSRFERRVDLQELNYHYQRMDKSIGRPEIESALCWDLKGKAADVQAARKSCPTHSDVSPHALEKKRVAKGFSNPYLATLSRAERAAIFRADILAHPKFTRQSREYRAGDAWYSGTQLEGPLHVKASKPSVPSTRNCLRMRAGWN